MAFIYLFLRFIKHIFDEICIVLLEIFIQIQKYEVRDTTVARASGIVESTLLLLLIEMNLNALYMWHLEGQNIRRKFRGNLSNA